MTLVVASAGGCLAVLPANNRRLFLIRARLAKNLTCEVKIRNDSNQQRKLKTLWLAYLAWTVALVVLFFSPSIFWMLSPRSKNRVTGNSIPPKLFFDPRLGITSELFRNEVTNIHHAMGIPGRSPLLVRRISCTDNRHSSGLTRWHFSKAKRTKEFLLWIAFQPKMLQRLVYLSLFTFSAEIMVLLDSSPCFDHYLH